MGDFVQHTTDSAHRNGASATMVPLNQWTDLREGWEMGWTGLSHLVARGGARRMARLDRSRLEATKGTGPVRPVAFPKVRVGGERRRSLCYLRCWSVIESTYLLCFEARLMAPEAILGPYGVSRNGLGALLGL